MCLVIDKPLNPDTRDRHDCSLEPFVNQMPCVSFAERPSSATSVLAPSSQTHCSQCKVNTVAAFCRPSFVWPAQIKCCAALAVDRVPFFLFLFFFLSVPVLADLVSSIWMFLSGSFPPLSSPLSVMYGKAIRSCEGIVFLGHQTVLLGAVGMKEQGGIEGDAACIQDSLLHATFNKVYVMFCILSTVFSGGNSY